MVLELLCACCSVRSILDLVQVKTGLRLGRAWYVVDVREGPSKQRIPKSSPILGCKAESCGTQSLPFVVGTWPERNRLPVRALIYRHFLGWGKLMEGGAIASVRDIER